MVKFVSGWIGTDVERVGLTPISCSIKPAPTSTVITRTCTSCSDIWCLPAYAAAAVIHCGIGAVYRRRSARLATKAHTPHERASQRRDTEAAPGAWRARDKRLEGRVAGLWPRKLSRTAALAKLVAFIFPSAVEFGCC